MSTTVPPLYAQLLDDAAVFPPGNASLPDAVQQRLRRRGTTAAPLVGPLLLPPALVADALAMDEPLTIVVVGRPGTPLAGTVASAASVAEAAGHSLAGIELGYDAQWRDALELGVPLAIEVAAGDAGRADLEDVADSDDQVRAKLRTGSTPGTPVPQTADLARFLLETARLGTAFKLTGGLHHAVSGHYDGEDQFGFLNVLVAVDAALSGDGDAVARLLDSRDETAVVTAVRSLPAARITSIRNAFHSYGCCDVLDPVNALHRLHLVEEAS